MLQWKSEHPWDTLRLIDFGFAQHFKKGTSAQHLNLHVLCSQCRLSPLLLLVCKITHVADMYTMLIVAVADPLKSLYVAMYLHVLSNCYCLTGCCKVY